jgi:hypothetical protein
MKKDKIENIVEISKNSFADVEIVPLRDFPQGIHQNEIHIEIREGVPVSIPRRFLKNMLTEKIIAKLPNEG